MSSGMSLELVSGVVGMCLQTFPGYKPLYNFFFHLSVPVKDITLFSVIPRQCQ